jgi:hypothetical protein
VLRGGREKGRRGGRGGRSVVGGRSGVTPRERGVTAVEVVNDRGGQCACASVRQRARPSGEWRERSHLSLHRGGTQGEAIKDVRREDVHAGVDQVAGKGAPVLDEAIDEPRVVWHHHRFAVLGRLVHWRHHDCPHLAVRFVEVKRGAQAEFARHVAVHHKERLPVIEQRLCERERPRGAKGLALLRERDLDAQILVLLKKVGHDLLAVVDGKHDLCDACILEELHQMQQLRLVSKFDQRLRL